MKNKILLSLSLVGLALVSLPLVPRALGQSAVESRTVAECDRLPSVEREACVRCVSRPTKHRYRTDAPPAGRCRPDR